MAKIFLTYDDRDRPLAREVEAALAQKGHQSVWGVDELIAGRGWGELMPRRIAQADAVVALLTVNSAQSPSLWCEVGAARALSITDKHTALLPVLVGLPVPPKFTEDMLVLRADPGNIAGVIDTIDSAVKAHLKAVALEAARTESPKIFVSHRHKDHEIASALTKLLVTRFSLSAHEIRCTSVQPYRLPFGKNTGERLRDEIGGAQVVLGILSPDTAESSYVMFELGAAWSQKIYTCPLLAKGHERVPGPIFDLTPARLWETADCFQLLDNLQTELKLADTTNVAGAVSRDVSELARTAAI